MWILHMNIKTNIFMKKNCKFVKTEMYDLRQAPYFNFYSLGLMFFSKMFICIKNRHCFLIIFFMFKIITRLLDLTFKNDSLRYEDDKTRHSPKPPHDFVHY